MVNAVNNEGVTLTNLTAAAEFPTVAQAIETAQRTRAEVNVKKEKDNT
jgi:hypothetical protein